MEVLTRAIPSRIYLVEDLDELNPLQFVSEASQLTSRCKVTQDDHRPEALRERAISVEPSSFGNADPSLQHANGNCARNG